MKESDLEKYTKKQIESIGGLCMKWVSPGYVGVPDRIALLPNGRTVYIELKNGEKGVLSSMQKYMHRKMGDLGHRTYVLKNKSEVDILITELRNGL